MGQPARYFRVAINRTNGGGVSRIRELDLRETPGGPTLTGTPIASGVWQAGFEASKAFDGLNTTQWGSENNGSTGFKWLGLDFGAGNEKDVGWASVMSSDVVTDSPQEYRFEFGRDVGGQIDWFTSWVPPYQTAWTTNEVRSSTRPTLTASSDSWRVYGTLRDSSIMALSALEFRTVRGGANVAVGGTPLSTSDFNASFVKANAFDGNNATAWASADNQQVPAIGYQFAAPILPLELYLRARQDANPEQGPRIAYTQQSPDGLTWLSVARMVRPTWTLGESMTWPLQQPGEELAVALRAAGLVGAYDARTVGSNLRVQALSGAGPNRITASNVRVQALVRPVTARLVTFPQIIGG